VLKLGPKKVANVIFTFSIKDLWHFFVRKMLDSLPPKVSTGFASQLARAQGSTIRFGFEKSPRLFFAESEGSRIYFPVISNKFFEYKSGFESRKTFLLHSYSLSHVQLRPEDVVIDCGANVGDLGLSLSHNPDVRYIAIEPNPADFLALQKNLAGENSVPLNFALGSSEGHALFYVSTKNADSSLIPPERYDKVAEIQVRRLDNVCLELGLERIRFLKLEAEGYEPEIVLGLGDYLQKVDYIGADLGPERGPDKLTTLVEVSNMLANSGFEMVNLYEPWLRVLFRNTRR
jgi:FkbM family methyltransferase